MPLYSPTNPIQKNRMAQRTFNPSSISGLIMWLDANDSTSFFDATSGGNNVTTDGGSIARWRDKSTSEKDFKQATSGNRPILKIATQNGRNSVRFDAIDDFMEMDANFSGLTAATYFIVLKIAVDPPTVESKTGHPIMFIYNIIANGGASHYPYLDSNIYDTSMTTSRKTVGNPSPNLTNFHLYNVSATSNSWTARLNKTQLFTTATNTFSQQEKTIGRSIGSNLVFYYFNGDISELVVYNSVLSANDRTSIENYLYQKWGIS
jgi:hypothetical protein